MTESFELLPCDPDSASRQEMPRASVLLSQDHLSLLTWVKFLTAMVLILFVTCMEL